MTLAAATREAARAHPFLFDALRAGVVNYSAAARFLEVDGDPEATATALRRYAESLDGPAGPSRGPGDESTPGADAPTPNVTMHRGMGVTDATADALLSVGDVGLVPDEGARTLVLAVGAVKVGALERVLGRARAEELRVEAAGVADGSLAVVVPDRDAAGILRLVEACVR